MKTIKKSMKIWLMIFLGLIATVNLTAQSNFKISGSPSFVVSGTSTIHDWDMKSSKAEGTASIAFENDQIKDIKSLVVNIPATSLKSGNGTMDNNAYKALETKSHSYIKYTLKDVNSVKYSGSTATISTSGYLTIAGTTKLVNMTVTAKGTEGNVAFDGKITFNMSDFKIDPPTAAFGTIKTGDKITVSFNVNYKNLNPEI